MEGVGVGFWGGMRVFFERDSKFVLYVSSMGIKDWFSRSWGSTPRGDFWWTREFAVRFFFWLGFLDARALGGAVSGFLGDYWLAFLAKEPLLKLSLLVSCS